MILEVVSLLRASNLKFEVSHQQHVDQYLRMRFCQEVSDLCFIEILHCYYYKCGE